ncbi:hypothetical protein [Paraburkholderia pallida]|uniref:Uncharacterized protein n=1 Tax=Paraburkholderia pallida TaxID=2547399 RepID=A0A4P7D6V4_9BURK|nr:hypothetical protein [Paraburkholderia pallida]QBR03918.1 hypothetical protein E1956_42620 [Paraburkholderia pallida]
MAMHESLLSLAEYLELSLNAGESVIMMQECNGSCAMYIGNAAKSQSSLIFQGTITALVAEEILQLTRTGRNQMEIAGQVYRFVRSVTHFEDRGAVVFAPA